MDIIINELSLCFSCTSEIEAQEKITLLIETHNAITKKISTTINYYSEKREEALYNHEVTPGYFIRSWVNNTSIDKVLREKFKQIFANSSNLSENYPDSIFEITDEDGRKEECIGLGHAYMQQSLCCSFQSANVWNTSLININHTYDDVVNDTTQSKTGIVKHYSDITHFDSHISWFQTKQLSAVKNGLDLWNNRQSLFPNMIFCGKTESQIKGGIHLLNRIKSVWTELDQIILAWKTTDMDFSSFLKRTPHNFTASRESTSTMNICSQDRRFQLPDGGTEIFELHIKIGDIRIHIYPKEQTKELYIGYVGKHLPTSTS